MEFFRRQFDRQIAQAEYVLNPFENLALPYLRGRVLDLGCGLGNLCVAAAGAGASVTALDACENAVRDLNRRAFQQALDIRALQADLQGWRSGETYDAVACIGLLMFFERAAALQGLRAVQEAVRPGGIAVVNVLTEGTTYLEMFGPDYHLFSKDELAAAFASWERLQLREDDFPAPGDTVKRFVTLIARKPSDRAPLT
jgi:tellurite methyltransferase